MNSDSIDAFSKQDPAMGTFPRSHATSRLKGRPRPWIQNQLPPLVGVLKDPELILRAGMSRGNENEMFLESSHKKPLPQAL